MACWVNFLTALPSVDQSEWSIAELCITTTNNTSPERDLVGVDSSRPLISGFIPTPMISHSHGNAAVVMTTILFRLKQTW